MKKDRQAWTNRLIDDFDGGKRLSPNPFLLTRIRQQIESRKARQGTERRFILALSALMAIFICLNIVALSKFSQNDSHTTSSKNSGVERLASAYDLKIIDY